MKNKIAIGLAALLLACGVSVKAQSIPADISAIYNDSLGSTNATYVIAGERKLTGDANKIAGLWFYNANSMVAVGAGMAKEWTPNKAAQAASYNLSVGIQLSTAIAPLNLFGITNKFARPFVGTFVGTPFSGQNQGNLMNATRAGVDLHIYQLNVAKNPVIFSGGGYYGNESGTGPAYSGNWIGLYLRIGWGTYSAPVLAANQKANAWSTVALNQHPSQQLREF